MFIQIDYEDELIINNQKVLAKSIQRLVDNHIDFMAIEIEAKAKLDILLKSMAEDPSIMVRYERVYKNRDLKKINKS